MLARLLHHIHLNWPWSRLRRWPWLWDLIDISYGLDPTGWAFNGIPDTRLHRLANWWFNDERLPRHPIRHFLHARGRHWTYEVFKLDVGHYVKGYARVLAGWGITVRRRSWRREGCWLCDWHTEWQEED